MKYILRDRETGRYLEKLGIWGDRPDEALTFEDMGEVREYCQAHRLGNVQASLCLMPYLMSLLRPQPRSSFLGA